MGEKKVKPRMNVALLSILLLACICPELARSASAATLQGGDNEQVIEGRVVKVSDGDTITVLDKDNRQHKIRFQGIDAPESKQDFGQVSKDNLATMIFGKQVKVVSSKTDKYGRTVGKVLLEGRDINIEQIKAGLAWHYKTYEKEQPPEDRVTYAAAEQEARAARRGLWQDPNPTPPGEWRADAKTDRWGPAPPEGTIIGNKNSKNYHRPDCAGYRNMAEANRVFFKTVEEAEAAGYKRAGNCPAVPRNGTTRTASAASGASAASSTAAVAAPASAATPATASTGAQPTSTTTTTTAPAATPSAIIGNKNSKIYHRSDCPGYKSVSEKNQVRFNTAAEAEQAGYKMAKNCPAPK